MNVNMNLYSDILRTTLLVGLTKLTIVPFNFSILVKLSEILFDVAFTIAGNARNIIKPIVDKVTTELATPETFNAVVNHSANGMAIVLPPILAFLHFLATIL